MHKLVSVLLALSYITLCNPLVASNHDDDDNVAAPGVERVGSTHSGLTLGNPQALVSTNEQSFNLNALRYRGLSLPDPLAVPYSQVIDDLANQTGNPALFMQDHAQDYYFHFTLPQLERLVDQKTLECALNPEHEAGHAYFKLKADLENTPERIRMHPHSFKSIVYVHSSLRLCPPLKDATHLEELWLYYNELTTVPRLSSLKNLRTLYLQRNKLIAPPDVTGLTSLKNLYLDSNLCDDLNYLKTLEVLNREERRSSTLQVWAVFKKDAHGHTAQKLLSLK